MSCMEHSCMNCPFMEFNNEPRTPFICPKCGGQMSHYWDEQADYDRECEREEDEDYDG